MGFLSFDKPMGPVLVQLVFYLWVAYLVLVGLGQIWDWIQYFDNDWDRALWGVIKTPFIVLFKIFIARIVAELALAVFRMDKSMHDQVTGRAAPPPKVD